MKIKCELVIPLVFCAIFVFILGRVQDVKYAAIVSKSSNVKKHNCSSKVLRHLSIKITREGFGGWRVAQTWHRTCSPI